MEHREKVIIGELKQKTLKKRRGLLHRLTCY
jgi:hypothetical protein